MTKELRLRLVRDSIIETDKGKKRTLKFQMIDTTYEYEVSMSFVFWEPITAEYRDVFKDIRIYDEIGIELEPKSRQVKLK